MITGIECMKMSDFHFDGTYGTMEYVVYQCMCWIKNLMFYTLINFGCMSARYRVVITLQICKLDGFCWSAKTHVHRSIDVFV